MIKKEKLLSTFGSLLQQAIKAQKTKLEKKALPPALAQDKTLRKLLDDARGTAFGKHYGFGQLLESSHPTKLFQENLPVFDYNKLHDEWLYRSIAGEKNVTWPGKVSHFALTSGTSEASSKRVPVTGRMIDAMQKTSRRQILTMADMDLPPDLYNRKILMLNGSSKLNEVDGHFEGDLSGILASKLPVWFHKFYKPGKKISDIKQWDEKLDEMVLAAKDWDIGFIAGVPAWAQILLTKIIDHYQLNNIHEIWPNFSIFVHGGVAFAPYKKSFDKLIGKKVIYLETYLASEGFFSYQVALDREDMRLVTDNDVFYEFIPFNEENFEADGQLVENPQTLLINEVEEGKDYALLISTSAGLWRYMIGDTIRFTSVKDANIVITGRTKHFLSLCGEHLSVDNMNHGIIKVAEHFNTEIKEFTVVGMPHEELFAHKWYVGVTEDMDEAEIKVVLDTALKELNDDYATEREHALHEVMVHTVPLQLFYDFLGKLGKSGASHKFPRVLNKAFQEKWEAFLDEVHAM